MRGIPLALATDGSPSGFHVLSVDGNRSTTRLVPSHDPAASLLRIVFESQAHELSPELLRDYPPGALLRGAIAASQLASTRIVVNFFEDGSRSAVAFSVAGCALMPMTRVTRIDPFVQEVYGRNASTCKPWVKPEISSHVWQAALPAFLAAGTHQIAVHATDEHDGKHVAFAVLEVI